VALPRTQLGELTASLRPTSWFKGEPTSKRKGREKGGREGRRDKGKGWEERE